MNPRPRLTYANVTATLALVLALGGGTVYAASQLGKNSVKSKHIAKGAVKKADLAKNAVTSPKIKDGTIKAKDIAAGVIQGLEADVTGSVTAGPQQGLDVAAPTPLPLTGKTSFTPEAGGVAALAGEAQFTIADTGVDPSSCQPRLRVMLNGDEFGLFLGPSTDETTPQQFLDRDAGGPFGILNPGVPLGLTAFLEGDADCTPDSRLDRLEVRIIQVK